MMKRFMILPAFPVLLAFAFTFTPTSHAQATMDSSQTDKESVMTQQIAEIQKVVDRWDDAVYQHDPYALELVQAPQFISISDTGHVTNRDQQVAQMVMKGAPHFTLTQKVVSVRMLGDVAVVNGTYDRVYKGSRLSHTQMQDQKGVFSQVYIRARNSWQCINSQRTLIVDNPLQKKKKKKNASQEKTLTHGLGFNFPGFHKTTSPDAQPPQ